MKTQQKLDQAELGKVLSEKVISEIKADYTAINEALQIAKTNGEIVLNLSQTKITEINRDISALELQLKQANIEIEKLSKRANLTIDISQIINDIQPNVTINCTGTAPPKIKIDCKFTNNGKHTVYVNPPFISIHKAITDELIDDNNFYYNGVISGSNVIYSSGGSGNNTFYITDLNNILSNNFRVSIHWSISLDDQVSKSIEPLLKNVIKKETFDSLTTKRFVSNVDYQ
ncbi:hypothetical protein [Methylophaga thalassica]|uniref:hypothetical protein n=1 Tax=Methylophaga aminisulfidivorans TaxID=230105 RepID=UPI003A930CBF